MSQINWDIDELVAKIMSDLRMSEEARLTRNSSSTSASISEQNDELPETLQTSDRVLVVDVVKRLANSSSAKRWIVPRNAVVTPSAKDELKALGVELIFGTSSVDFAAASTLTTISASNVPSDASVKTKSEPIVSTKNENRLTRALLIIHRPETQNFPSSVSDYLSRNSDLTTLTLTCLKETSARIADEIVKDKSLKVVLATRDVAIGTIWTNRRSGVRSVPVNSFEQARRDIEATNANVVIVDPTELGSYQLRRVVDYFIRASR